MMDPPNSGCEYSGSEYALRVSNGLLGASHVGIREYDRSSIPWKNWKQPFDILVGSVGWGLCNKRMKCADHEHGFLIERCCLDC